MLEIMIVCAVIVMLGSIAVPSFRVARETARTNSCLNNLRIISQAKNQLALADGLGDEDVPTSAQISPYLKFADSSTGLPAEPLGGTYSINEINIKPTCSVGSPHVLQD